jgi:hypothetical protein
LSLVILHPSPISLWLDTHIFYQNSSVPS